MQEEADQYTRSIAVKGWKVSSSKCPISNAKEIDELTSALDIPIPEMIFGNNKVSIHHESGIDLEWNAYSALDCVDKNGTELKVKYSADWNKSRQEHDEIKQVTKPYDWTYSTTYRGTASNEWKETEELLPMALLKRQDPILFHDEVILYESELDDNGISIFTVRVRVMPERLLLLARFFMRLDQVVFRVRDTRVYIEFESKKVLREHLIRERAYDDLFAKIQHSKKEEIGPLLSDANWVAENCPIVDGKMEQLVV